ncbi:ABC transporter substrate-binding protein [Fulvivirga sediminis]|uniref:ABC transporter substrate-binding protein n=1 Tax=Fulvivirga sediminis TaxID=2803949 RepID=A0A937K2V5_9BACT|nr:ABC transporter substrate-binding protein [Fulvivirga sediminis]MBL3658257.1 ABC transporter substrate-binding protein [Fulvivirga sediminis]
MLEKRGSKGTIKIGVLVPRSKEYPKAGTSVVDGIKLYFTIFKNHFERGKVELVFEDIGVGSFSSVSEKTQKLILEHQVVAIAAHINSIVAVELAQLLHSYKIPLLVSNLGEAIIGSSIIPENLFLNTFQFWQSYFLLGQYLSENYNYKFAIISSLYDSGYDPLRGFRKGADNGKIVNEIFLNASEGSGLISELENFPIISKDSIPALFFPPRLLNHFIDNTQWENQHLVVTPFYTNNNNQPKYWAMQAESLSSTDENLTQGAYEYLETNPDLFLILGYRCGALLYACAQSLTDDKHDYQMILDTWGDFSLKLAKETFSINPENHELSGDIHLYEGTSLSNKKCMSVVQSSHISNDVMRELSATKTAFTNPYMFY